MSDLDKVKYWEQKVKERQMASFRQRFKKFRAEQAWRRSHLNEKAREGAPDNKAADLPAFMEIIREESENVQGSN